jgi:hypothetical protein
MPEAGRPGSGIAPNVFFQYSCTPGGSFSMRERNNVSFQISWSLSVPLQAGMPVSLTLGRKYSSCGGENGTGGILRRDADDGAVEIVESFFVDDGGNFAGEASGAGVLVQDDDLVGLLHGCAIASRSSGETVRRSTISISIPSLLRMSAASSAVYTMAA